MKLTEKQLSQLFKNSKDTDIPTPICNLEDCSDASDARLSAVEQIADNSAMSASYQIMDQLQEWSSAIGADIELSLKPKFSAQFFNWFKPTVVTAAIVTAVYFITPQIDSEIQIQQKPDRIMFTTSFESHSDAIKNSSFEAQNKTKQQDAILKINFS